MQLQVWYIIFAPICACLGINAQLDVDSIAASGISDSNQTIKVENFRLGFSFILFTRPPCAAPRPQQSPPHVDGGLGGPADYAGGGGTQFASTTHSRANLRDPRFDVVPRRAIRPIVLIPPDITSRLVGNSPLLFLDPSGMMALNSWGVL